MNNFQVITRVCIFWASIFNSRIFLANGQNSSTSGGISYKPPPTFSMYAMKAKGTCNRPQIEDEYTQTCPDSAGTIVDNHDVHVYHPTLKINVGMQVRQYKDLLMNEILNRALHNSKVPKHHPKFGNRLLESVMAMYQKACPVVPPSFLQTIFHLFSYMHWLTAQNRKEYLPFDQQKWMMKILNNCTLRMKLPTILTDSCREIVLTKQNCDAFICTRKEQEFRLMRTDPIVDVVFKSMELIQSVCFPMFTESYRMFHFFHLAVADMFTDEIKMRWTHQMEAPEYWKRLLGPTYEFNLMNLEKCNEGIIADMKFSYRIPRSSMPARIRMTGSSGETARWKILGRE